MYIIKDWAGNLMIFGEFKTFDDAQEYLLDKFTKEEDLQEYQILEKD